MDESSPSQRGAFIAKLGAWLQVAPVLGIVASMFGIIEAFHVIKYSGAGDPVRLRAVMDKVLVYNLIAVSAALIGLVLLTLSITVCCYRAPWMLKFLRFYGALTLVLSLALLAFGYFKISFYLPYLPFAVFFLVFAQLKKEEFMRAVPGKRKLPSCYNLDP